LNLEQWVLPDGTATALGNHRPPEEFSFPVRAGLPDLPESQWREFDLRANSDYPVKIKNQGSFGACNGHAAASAAEDARYVAGLDYVPLSPWMIYADLCNGFERGSIIAEALTHCERKGTCNDSLVPHGTINPRKISSEARENAKRFKIEIGYRISDFREMCIACQLRMPINFSVPVNAGFNMLDAEGVPRNRAGWHNHAVQAGFAMKRGKNGWLIGMRNSWGEQWGINGYCWVSAATVKGSGFDAYAILATEYDPQQAPPPIA